MRARRRVRAETEYRDSFLSLYGIYARRGVALVGALTFFASVLSQSPSYAYVYGGNPGASAANTDQAGNLLWNRDGIYLSQYVTSSNGFNPSIHAGNVRPIQIGSGGTEFLGLGWFVGWSYSQGEFTSPEYYIDGISCYYGSCPYFNEAFSTGSPYGPTDNSWNTFQIQRKWNGSQYVFEIWVGPGYGGMATPPMQHPYDVSFSMSQGAASWGAEDAQNNNNNMYGDYDYIYTHGNGAASTNPPGITNMSGGWAGNFAADYPCSSALVHQPPDNPNGGGYTYTDGYC